MDEDEDRIKAELGGVINSLSKIFPDASRASADLWKFAKVHDRRNYQLIRFAMAAGSDYRTVTKAIKELVRRVQSGNNTALLETLTPLLYRCSSLIFNRSHIPAIMNISKTDENGLANAAHELLKEISSRNPEVLEAQVQEMCKDLEAHAPQSSGDVTASTDGAGAEKILKACSGFAKKLPSKLPKERKFLQALANYALYSSSPRAAKLAVSILMVAADRREMYAKDLVQRCVAKWTYGSDRFLTRLAALSQLNLLAPREADEESDAIISIAVNQILLSNRSPQPDSGYSWSDDVDDETAAKEWALKIVVNRLRAKGGADSDDDFRAHADPVYSTLIKLVTSEGELSKKKDTPATQKSRLRLLAARLLIKLCASDGLCDHLLTPRDFNSIALVAQDPLLPVRSGFIDQLTKKLVQRTDLSHRWYTIPFLLAFEPNAKLKASTFTWLRSRAAFFSQQAQASGRKGEQQTVMESIFSRLLSLLAYHPDYPSAELDEQTKNGDLADFARYILFYLSAVANERNLSLIFHIAQRVKQTRDGITKSDEITTRLHTLSDLAQATIRRFADIYSQQHKFGGGAAGGTNILQTYPGKLGVPSSIFAPMGSHREAQEVAEKNFLPDEVDDLLDGIVRSTMRPPKSGGQGGAGGGQAKKRKSELNGTNGNASANASKKARRDNNKDKATTTRPGKSSSTTAPINSPKTSNKRRKKSDEDDWSSDEDVAKKVTATTTVSTTSRRRSSRGTSKKEVSYVDRDSDEDDMEMEEWDRRGGAEGEDDDDVDEDEEREGETEQDKESTREENESESEQEEPEQDGEDGDKQSAMEVDDTAEPRSRSDTKSKTKTKTAIAEKAPESKTKRSTKTTTTTTTAPTRRSSRRG